LDECVPRQRPALHVPSLVQSAAFGNVRSRPELAYARCMLSEGELAPDFTATAHDGTRVTLSELAGKYVLLWFYPAADTPG
jgi:cytochrome oxidase Cu insertion factor (SCO1/SenC/PrrC family)